MLPLNLKWENSSNLTFNEYLKTLEDLAEVIFFWVYKVFALSLLSSNFSVYNFLFSWNFSKFLWEILIIYITSEAFIANPFIIILKVRYIHFEWSNSYNYTMIYLYIFLLISVITSEFYFYNSPSILG